MRNRLNGSVVMCAAGALSLVFLLAASPAHAQCGAACQEVSAGCFRCVVSPLAGGCIQTGPCACRRAICPKANGAGAPADWRTSAVKSLEVCSLPPVGAAAGRPTSAEELLQVLSFGVPSPASR